MCVYVNGETVREGKEEEEGRGESDRGGRCIKGRDVSYVLGFESGRGQR